MIGSTLYLNKGEYIIFVMKPIHPGKYPKAKKVLHEGETYVETMNLMKKLYGSGVSRSTIAELKKKPVKKD